MGLIHNPDTGIRTLTLLKSNLASTEGGLTFTLSRDPAGPDEAPKLKWLGHVEASARQILSEAETTRTSSIKDAEEFLIAALKDGPVPSRELYEAA